MKYIVAAILLFVAIWGSIKVAIDIFNHFYRSEGQRYSERFYWKAIAQGLTLSVFATLGSLAWVIASS